MEGTGTEWKGQEWLKAIILTGSRLYCGTIRITERKGLERTGGERMALENKGTKSNYLLK